MSLPHAGGHGGVRPRHLLLLLASLAGVVMATWRLGVASTRGDEIYYRDAALDHLAGDWLANAQHPPLAKELMALSMGVLGDGTIPGRLPAATCAWLTGFVVAGLVWEVTGRTKGGVLAGVGAALLWWLLPFEPARMATLEAPLALFVALATWAWLRARVGWSSWWFLLGGAAVGLAVATKLTGALAVAGLLPVLLLGVRDRRDPAVLSRLDPRARRRLDRLATRPVRRTVTAVAVAAVGALAAWAVCYLPLGGDAFEAVRTSVTFQAEHAARGHARPVAGRAQLFPPWWSGWWYQAQHLGPVATTALWALAIAGAVRHRRRSTPVVATLAASALALAVSPLQLPHYQYVWWPTLLVLGAAAWVPAPGATAPRRAPWAPLVASALALALTLPVAGVAAQHVRGVLTIEVDDYRAAALLVERSVPEQTPVTVWAQMRAVRLGLPAQELSTRLPADANPAVLVVDLQWAQRKGLDLALWERCRSAQYDRQLLGAVVVYVRDDSVQADPSGGLPEGCEALPRQGG
ncbi:ArnT family glycosyltransferase [Janibacter melonis]|uniref:ArnT family glycosyltransferase n=1 Tax=Janibacter melonis TaxID=262209 RepID=UPI00174E35B1|nr:glycosyltransferase family 39 protein [Janibacter melonis]